MTAPGPKPKDCPPRLPMRLKLAACCNQPTMHDPPRTWYCEAPPQAIADVPVRLYLHHACIVKNGFDPANFTPHHRKTPDGQIIAIRTPLMAQYVELHNGRQLGLVLDITPTGTGDPVITVVALRDGEHDYGQAIRIPHSEVVTADIREWKFDPRAEIYYRDRRLAS